MEPLAVSSKRIASFDIFENTKMRGWSNQLGLKVDVMFWKEIASSDTDPI